MTSPPTGSASDRLISCACYVRELPDHFQKQLRFGAHALDCPAYRRSADVVNDLEDMEVRAILERYSAVDPHGGD